MLKDFCALLWRPPDTGYITTRVLKAQVSGMGLGVGDVVVYQTDKPLLKSMK